MNVRTPIAAAAMLSLLAGADAVHAEIAPSTVTYTPGPVAGAGVYRRADAPDIAALCAVGPDGRRVVLPVEAVDADDPWAGVGIGWRRRAPMTLLPGMVVADDGTSIAYSGETHFGMPTVDGVPEVQTHTYSGETHFGYVLDAFDREWWTTLDASGETHFGRPGTDGAIRWQKWTPFGARPVVQRGEATASSGPAGCDDYMVGGVLAQDVADALTAR